MLQACIPIRRCGRRLHPACGTLRAQTKTLAAAGRTRPPRQGQTGAGTPYMAQPRPWRRTGGGDLAVLHCRSLYRLMLCICWSLTRRQLLKLQDIVKLHPVIRNCRDQLTRHWTDPPGHEPRRTGQKCWCHRPRSSETLPAASVFIQREMG